MTTVKKFRKASFLLSTGVFMLTIFMLTLSTAGVSYGLNHSGNITSSQTWYAADNPHIITGNVRLDYNGILVW